jgi:hypothetical protein
VAQPSSEVDKLVVVSLNNLEVLVKKGSAKQNSGSVSIIKCPFPSGSCLVTDIKQMSESQLIISFSNGKLWIIDYQQQNNEKSPLTFGIDNYKVCII